MCGDCGVYVNHYSYITFFVLISIYRLCSTLSILPISLRCAKRGERLPPSFAYRFTDEALQQKEQVFKESCGIGNRQVTRNHQASHGYGGAVIGLIFAAVAGLGVQNIGVLETL